MSEYYDHCYRLKTLAEFNFFIDDNEEYHDDNYIYCLCSRAYIRDGVKKYYVDKEYGSESDADVVEDSHSQDVDEHSHVHFSVDTSHKTKCEKDEGASCYCSASHTDNYCSTDELDPSQTHGFPSHALQPSDSGADLTYQDCHSDYTTLDKIERMEQDIPDIITTESFDSNENYLSEDTWEKFWAANGERIIWASWIKKYSDYINPAYLDDNNDLLMDENNIPKQHSAEPICVKDVVDSKENVSEGIRERKFSYDSKVNPYKHGSKDQNSDDKYDTMNEKIEKGDSWTATRRRRSCSEHDRILSPRTLQGTDSLTNVTKITLSSCNVTSSHVTSESTPTDDYSVSSTTSDDQFNDQTRIANNDDNSEHMASEELDTEQYWQFLWKKHFGDQYALHYAKYIECHEAKNQEINVLNVQENKLEELKACDVECENSEGNSQELPSVIEVQTKIENIKLEQKVTKPRKRNKHNNRIISSVGVLLQNLLKEQKEKSFDETVDGEDSKGNIDPNKSEPVAVDTNQSVSESNNMQNNSSMNSNYNYDDGDGDPPEERPRPLKRSHEIDEDKEDSVKKIKSTIKMMGFSCFEDKLPHGELLYKQRNGYLLPPKYRALGKRTYFDDDGTPHEADQNRDIPDDYGILTDNDQSDLESDAEKSNSDANKLHDTTSENENVASKNEDKADKSEIDSDDAKSNSQVDLDSHFCFESVKILTQPKRWHRPKRQLRYDNLDTEEMPAEIREDPKLYKYWNKRHSLFHRFDEGIRLDRESWFSVTPEGVARHVATRCDGADIVLDAFCGAGGNAIQFAARCERVIAIDIDPVKIEMAKHNAAVYGVAHKIEFIVGDFFELAPTLKADLVFLSPPWGGPNYTAYKEYDIETTLEPKPASELMNVASNINRNIALYLPRNSRFDQITSLGQTLGGTVEVEQSYLNGRYVAITAYFYD